MTQRQELRWHMESHSLGQSSQINVGSLWVSSSSISAGVSYIGALGNRGGVWYRACRAANKSTRESALGGDAILYVQAVEMQNY